VVIMPDWFDKLLKEVQLIPNVVESVEALVGGIATASRMGHDISAISTHTGAAAAAVTAGTPEAAA
jgi:hypothetical protein